MKQRTAIFFAFFGLYLLSSGRTVPYGDSNIMWQVADHLVRDGGITVDRLWVTPRAGKDGGNYSLYPLAASLVHVPGAALRSFVTSLAPRSGDVLLPLASHVGPAALGALTCALFFGLARRFVGPGAASLATLAVGLSTATAYWSRSSYGEMIQIASFTGYVLAIHDALADPSAGTGRRVGLWAGLLFNSKLVFVLAIPGVAAVFAWRLRREPRRLLVFFGWAALMMLPAAALVLYWNWARWGNPFDSGYESIGGGSTLAGLWGLFLSPGKSLFLYSPPLVLALYWLPRLARLRPAFFVALLGAAGPVVLLYAHYNYWHGGFGWGPRYITFLVPAFALPLALGFEALLGSAHRRILGPLVALVLVSGLAVQLVGYGIHYGFWYRIELAVSTSWLGQSRCATTAPADSEEAKACFPDHEDVWAMNWVPAFQPILAHAWLIRHHLRGDPWDVAEADAPWQLQRQIHTPAAAGWYDGIVIDWWWNGWTRYPLARIVVAAGMLLILALGAWRWRRAAPG